MIGFISFVGIIITDKIEKCHVFGNGIPTAGQTAHPGKIIKTLCYQARVIQAADFASQIPGNPQTSCIEGFAYFIPDAPNDNRGMIPVAFYPRFNIFLPPLLKIQMIIFIFLWRFPCIKNFIYYHHAKPVASIECCRRRWIVAGSYSVKPVLFQYFYPSLFSPVNGSCTQRTVVVMITATNHFNRNSVNG